MPSQKRESTVQRECQLLVAAAVVLVVVEEAGDPSESAKLRVRRGARLHNCLVLASYKWPSGGSC